MLLYVYTPELQKLMMGWAVGMILFVVVGIILIRLGSIDLMSYDQYKPSEREQFAGNVKRIIGFICIGIAVIIFFYAMVMCNIKG